MMIADLTSRRGFRNRDRKPRTVRSWVVKIGCSLPGPAVDDQLLFEQQVLCNDCTAAAWLDQLCDGGEQVEKKVNDIFHAARV